MLVLLFAYNVNANSQHLLRHVSSMPFLFEARYGLLTYSQCGELDAQRVNDHLGDLGAECIVARENHRVTGVHLHAFFMFERKFRTRNERLFDVDGRHPNIVRGYGTPEAGYDYAIKDGVVEAGGLGRPGGDRVSKDGSVWSQLVLAGDREEFFDMCARLAPRALLCNFTSLRCYADWRFRADPEPYEHPGGVSLVTTRYPGLDTWVQQNLGGSGYSGKCCLVRRLFARTAPLGPRASSPGGGLRASLESRARLVYILIGVGLTSISRTTKITSAVWPHKDR